ncbi:protein HOS4-like [Dendronephthya gigantea]|uniref:protein HOS4-like n=1 Tax=Dendronephthya gigantea TaxID=151771 RepID=UPI00106D9497|nr:protein HOS4-like [Dendronephthya gigantea]
MTVLETLDQSPMRRSQKMKNLLNIEYYDINSDDELNSKIKRRSRTKSLNDQDRETVANVPARREFRSSEDLTRSGRANQEEVNRVSRDEEQAWRTNTNYENFDVTSAANNSSSKGHSKPTYAAKLVSHDKEKLDEYQRHSQVQVPMYNTRNVHTSLKPNTAITVNSNTKGLNSHERYSKRQLGRDKGITVREIEKGNDLSGYSTNNTRPKESKIDGLKQYRKDMNTVSTLKRNVKKLPSTLYKSKDKAGKGHAHHKESSKDNKESKSTIYPNEDFKASEGKYNIAKAEEEWKKRYGRLPYNKKDPLHQSSDKDFSILFKNTVDECATQNSTGQRGLSKKRFSLEEAIRNTSTSSLFSPNNSVNEKSSNSIARNSDDISTTLHQLSSYVISGYKDDSKENSNHISSQGDQETKAAVAVRYRRYYLDDEGDLSHILDNTTESRKLSMLVHCIIRLREVYSIQPFPMSPQMEEHPMNLGNPQLRDAIQSKPMKVVKDIILANKSVDINTCSQSGDSALHRAAIEGDIDAIRIIINQGGNVNIRDRNGFQPVHQALSYHHYKAAMFLMDCGVDLMSYTSKRIQQFARVRAIARQYLRQTLKTPL